MDALGAEEAGVAVSAGLDDGTAAEDETLCADDEAAVGRAEAPTVDDGVPDAEVLVGGRFVPVVGRTGAEGRLGKAGRLGSPSGLAGPGRGAPGPPVPDETVAEPVFGGLVIAGGRLVLFVVASGGRPVVGVAPDADVGGRVNVFPGVGRAVACCAAVGLCVVLRGGRAVDGCDAA